MPFANADEREIHFKKHGYEFNANTALEYEQMADVFMTMPLTLAMRECTRPNGTDRLRINITNSHFGVGVVASDVIQTYYVVPLHKVIRRGGTALAFFNYECTRADI